MLIIVEVILTVIAWNRGWKGYALIPAGVVLAIGFFIGLGIGLNGGSAEDVKPVVVLDIIAMLVLIYMCIKKREVEKKVILEDSKK